MTIIRLAPEIFAACIVLSPTPPAPTTTTLSPGRVFAVFTTAPIPVITPQESKQAASLGINSGIFTI